MGLRNPVPIGPFLMIRIALFRMFLGDKEDYGFEEGLSSVTRIKVGVGIDRMNCSA